MKNRETALHLLLPSIILIPMILLVLLAPQRAWKSGYYPLTGRYIETSTGQHMIYRNTDTGEMRYVFMIPNDGASMFDDFETGDAIRVQSEPLIQETDDGIYYSRVYEPKKIRNTPQIPELTEDVLSYVESLDTKFSTNQLHSNQT